MGVVRARARHFKYTSSICILRVAVWLKTRALKQQGHVQASTNPAGFRRSRTSGVWSSSSAVIADKKGIIVSDRFSNFIIIIIFYASFQFIIYVCECGRMAERESVRPNGPVRECAAEWPSEGVFGRMAE